MHSAFTGGDIGATYNFGSERTKLTLSAGAGLTYYFNRPGNSNDEENAYLDLSVSHKATARLSLGALLHVTYQVEPDFNYNIGSNRRSGNYFYTQDKFSVTYIWTPRFSTLTSYTPGIVKYDNSSVGVFADRFENTFGNEFRFLLVPDTTIVAEYRYEVINYDSAPLDSNTHFVLAGFDHNFNARLALSLRGGVELRTGDVSGDQTNPYFESTLAYTSGRNSINFTTRYSIEEPDVFNYAARNTFRTGLQVKYNLITRLSSTVSAYYQHSDYQHSSFGGPLNPEFTEDSLDFGIGLRYAITRNLGVAIGYNYTNISSGMSTREYSRNRYSAGVSFSF